MSETEYMDLQRRLDEHFDTRYRKLDTCDERHAGIDSKLEKVSAAVTAIDLKFAVLNDKTSTSNRWLATIATATVTAIIGATVIALLKLI